MAEAEVKTKIKAKDETEPAFTKAKTNLKEFGANVSAVGMRMTGMFTVPVVAGLAALGKYGQDAVKTVGDLKTSLDGAVASNDPDKIRAAQQAWNDLSPSVKEAADAYGKMQAAMKPVNDALGEAKTQLLVGLVPVIQSVTPMLVSLAGKVRDAAVWFAGLPDNVKI